MALTDDNLRTRISQHLEQVAVELDLYHEAAAPRNWSDMLSHLEDAAKICGQAHELEIARIGRSYDDVYDRTNLACYLESGDRFSLVGNSEVFVVVTADPPDDFTSGFFEVVALNELDETTRIRIRFDDIVRTYPNPDQEPF